jgi:hypothetical protein
MLNRTKKRAAGKGEIASLFLLYTLDSSCLRTGLKPHRNDGHILRNPR